MDAIKHTPGRVFVQRLNGGSLRRYHLPKAIAIVSHEPGRQRRTAVISRALPMLTLPVSAGEIATQLKAARRGREISTKEQADKAARAALAKATGGDA